MLLLNSDSEFTISTISCACFAAPSATCCMVDASSCEDADISSDVAANSCELAPTSFDFSLIFSIIPLKELHISFDALAISPNSSFLLRNLESTSIVKSPDAIDFKYSFIISKGLMMFIFVNTL